MIILNGGKAPESFTELFVFIIMIITFLSIFVGVIEGLDKRGVCQTSGKWGYVVPLYKPTCKFTKWMGE